jgi:uncharacterized protein YecE (DUF72 family)
MLYTGTSGYSFREWVGTFYPPKTPAAEYLAFYASRLNSVEINHTFRRFPTTKLLASWAEKTPESFTFSLKMHQSVTHRARLNSVGESVEEFLKAAEPLGPRLGAILFQLPPYFRANLDRLKSFLQELPPGHRYALEFRHESWNDPAVVDALRDRGVALCAAEAEIGESVFTSTAPHGYVRLRKVPPYSDQEIQQARGQIADILSQVEDLYVYVKHDDQGVAPETVLRLRSDAGAEKR